jgi:2-dehydropantoate 2-reductase
MKITIVGLGAIGGLLAARLAQAGHEVNALARGATLTALRERGLVVESRGERETVRIATSDDAAALGEAELVIVALKAPALPGAAPAIARLLGRDGLLLTAMNGVPWWFMRHGPHRDDAPLASIDPGGSVGRTLPGERALGGVVHMSCSLAGPAHVRHAMGRRLIVGEPDGTRSERLARVAGALREAGFEAEESADIRRDAWYKLWGNTTMNPVSALTGAGCEFILDEPLVVELMVRAMAEAAAIGARIGCPIAESGAQRLELARKLGNFKTSMLQDVEAGRAIELDALVGVVREIGARVELPTPQLDALYGLTRLMARARNLAVC